MRNLLAAMLGVWPCLASVTVSAADPVPAVAGALPRPVDLRPRFVQYGLKPRSQGARNTCSVFVTTAALEFAYSKHLGRGVPLSPEYLNWACNQVIKNETADRGQFFHDLLKGFERYGICPEADMPYQPKFDPALKPSPQAREAAKEFPKRQLKVHWINPWKKEQGLTDDQLSEIKTVLAQGWPVAAGSGHSRLLVGYTDDDKRPGGGMFITKDSGSGKFDTVTYEFAKTKIGDVFWVDATPKPAKE